MLMMMLMMMTPLLLLLLLILPPIGALAVDVRVVQHILPPIVASGEWKLAEAVAEEKIGGRRENEGK